MLEAVIFDVDGLLVDTETADWEAWRRLYERHGLSLTPEEYAASAGRYGSWERRYAEIARRTGADADALHAERFPWFLAGVERALQPRDGLPELLETLRAAGIPRAVASASDRDWVQRLLERLALREEFQAIVTGHDCPARKPAPDCYLRAAAALQAAPGRCVALEDSATGIDSARQAGMGVVAVPNAVTRYQDLSRAHLLVGTLREVDLRLLRQLAGEAR